MSHWLNVVKGLVGGGSVGNGSVGDWVNVVSRSVDNGSVGECGQRVSGSWFRGSADQWVKWFTVSVVTWVTDHFHNVAQSTCSTHHHNN